MDSCLAQGCLTGATVGSLGGQIFAQLIQSLLAAQCTLTDNNHLPPDRTQEILANPEFDFIVVGGGTAGSIVASRLSENPNWKVLLIERGTDPSLMSKIPALLLFLQGTSEDYAYKVEPNSRYCQGTKDKSCVWAKGKALGGSSAINAMMHIHGNKKDYDSWSDMGNKGWSYDEVLPYFRKSEDYEPEILEKYGKQYFGVGGPLKIRSYMEAPSPMSEIISSAGEEMGYPKLDIFNGKNNIGFGRSHGAIDQGVRQNVAEAFLSRAKNRNNLFLMKSTRADSVIIDNKKATGVKVTLENGATIKIQAQKEVILSAGAIASPQILMLSGIGPKKHLKEVGIDATVDLPVGRNLQDHILMLLLHFAYKNASRHMPAKTALLDAGYEYLVHRSGPLASTSGLDVAGFINVDNVQAKYPNSEIHFVFIPRGESFQIEGISNAFAFSDGIRKQMHEIGKDMDSILAGPVVLNPKSRGKIELRSKNPQDPVKIYANYFDDEEDLQVMVKAVKILYNMENTETFKKYGIKLRIYDVEGCENIEKATDKFWKCMIKHFAATVYHHCGSAKMGPASDKTAVVNEQLQVHGVDGLRIIDASIMPLVTSGNTNSPTMMIAEKGSDMIKKSWTLKEEL